MTSYHFFLTFLYYYYFITLQQYSNNKHGECITEINGSVRERERRKRGERKRSVPTTTTTTRTMASSNSPCAACKFLRRKCQPECAFAPYFPPDQPQKFANVHRIFGASNVTKLLNDLHPHQREDAVNSLAYEAEMRLRDPVYGCVGVISLLQHQLRQLQMDLYCAKSELSRYQNLSIATATATAGHGLLTGDSVVTAAYHHLQNATGGGSNGRDHHHYQHHQFFPQHQQNTMVRNFDGGNNYDAGLLAMNISASLGQFNQLQHHSAAGGAGGGDDRRTVNRS